MSEQQHPSDKSGLPALPRPVGTALQRAATMLPTAAGAAALASNWIVGYHLLATELGLAGIAVGLATGWASARRNSAAQRADWQARRALKRSLNHARYKGSTKYRPGERGAAQLVQAEKRFAHFAHQLATKFEVGELTYDRYMAAGDSLYRAVLDNLDQVAALLDNLEALDARYARKAIKRMRWQWNRSPEDERMLDVLYERLDIAERLEAEVRSRLADNERALTELDRVNVALTQLRTSRVGSAHDLDAAMDQLRQLADRTGHYAS